MLLAKITVVLFIGVVLDLFLRGGNPRWRQDLWRGVMLGVLLVAPLSLVPPMLALPVLEVSTGSAAPKSGVDFIPLAERPLPSVSIDNTENTSTVVKPSINPTTAQSVTAIANPSSDAMAASLGLDTILFSLWGLGALIFLGALLRDMRKVYAVLAGAKSAEPGAHALAKDLCMRLGLAGSPRIAVSSATSSPFVVGILRPTIVLPKWLKESAQGEDLAPVLAHELAHLRSRDLLWIGVGNILTALLWFHPLTWLMRRFHSDACEQLSDGVASNLVGPHRPYAQTLARMAIAHNFAPATAIPMARRPRIMNRLALLEQGFSVARISTFRRWRNGLILVLGVTTLTTVELVSAEAGGVGITPPSDSSAQPISRLEGQEGTDQEAERRRYVLLVRTNPMDPKVPDYLMRAKPSGYASEGYRGRSHPLSEQVKTLYRQHLAREANPEVAWLLWQIIGVQLSNTSIGMSNGDGSYGKWAREAPQESFATIQEALEVVFNHTEPNSDRWREAGIMLAKLHMMRGDWKGVDQQLILLGQEPLDPALRSNLHAPPLDWNDLAKRWEMSEAELRSGSCGLSFSFEKEGLPLAGVHVMVRPAKAKETSFRTGFAADTILASADPVEFGYRDDSTRKNTRYGVSGSDGSVHIRNLPEIEFDYEILVPTGNFTETIRSWDLLVELPSGEMHRSPMNDDTRILLPFDGFETPKLVPGREVAFPHVQVIPSFYSLNVEDWDPVPAEGFELSWPQFISEQAKVQVAYDVTLTLSAPAEAPDWSWGLPLLHSQSVRTTETKWLMGQKGVGDLRLRPGNFYLIDVAAVDVTHDALLATWNRTLVWVPWEHGTQVPPLRGEETSPIHHNSWKNGQYRGHLDSDERPDQSLDRFLAEKPNAFEHAYVRVGKAWQTWLWDGEEAARPLLESLLAELPTGNVARATAEDLLKKMTLGQAPPSRLSFVAGD